MKTLNGKITLLVNQNSTSIELVDGNSRMVIAKVEISAENFQKALSRLSNVDCSIVVPDKGIENIGKKKVFKTFTFKLPKGYDRSNINLWEFAKKNCPAGYEFSKSAVESRDSLVLGDDFNFIFKLVAYRYE
jgi:DUF4097 and DUF4098 domain-containing protein YvlB